MITRELEDMWQDWKKASRVRPGERVALAQAIALSRLADSLGRIANAAERDQWPGGTTGATGSH